MNPQAATFIEQGHLLLENMISEAELAMMGEIYDACFEEVEQRRGFKGLGGADAQGRQTLPQVLGPSEEHSALKATAYYARCRDFAQECFGPDIVQRGEHMILKPAGYGAATPWHQDQAYHAPGQSYRNVNFWLPLDGASVESGCMHFVPHSHGGMIVPHAYLDPADTNTALVAQDQDYWAANGVAVPCPRGACTLHHSYTLHYAGPNTTDAPRRAYIVVFGLAPTPLERPWVLPWQRKPQI